MSRAKAKLAKLTDLQCKQPTYIITKKDCDLICNALLNTYDYSEIKGIYHCFKDLTLN